MAIRQTVGHRPMVIQTSMDVEVFSGKINVTAGMPNVLLADAMDVGSCIISREDVVFSASDAGIVLACCSENEILYVVVEKLILEHKALPKQGGLNKI